MLQIMKSGRQKLKHHNLCESSGSESEQEISASRRKMELRDYNSGEDLCATDTNLEQGYRHVDLKSFSSFISNVHKCNEGEWICRYQ